MRIAFLVLFAYTITQPLAQAGNTNVLVIIADDLGWGDLSLNGNNEVETPNLDALADEGLKFEKFYVCPNGSTTSASLLTGRYHYRTGVVGVSGSEAIMFGSEKTIAEAFSENGYRTGWFGNWHHGTNWPHNAEGQGFHQYTNGEDLIQKAIEFISSEDPKPFLSMVLLPNPKIINSSDLKPDERIEKVNQGIVKVDKSVGRLLDELSKSNQRENTIVLFLSDNGPDQFGDTEGRYNSYFYGGKGSVHEGGVRVPCYISWPNKIAAGSRFSRISAHIDWYPTLTELCGLKSKSRQLRIDGKSLAPVLLNEGDSGDWPNRILFTSWTPPGFDVKNASVSVRTDRWVALKDPKWRRDESVLEKQNGWELYDLKTDPFQSRELGEEYPFLLSELSADFSFWMDHTTDDGIGPIATQIGHTEWPTVTLQFGDNKIVPVRIIADGRYQIDIANESQDSSAKIRIGQQTYKLPIQQPIELNGDVNEIEVISGNVSKLTITSLLEESE